MKSNQSTKTITGITSVCGGGKTQEVLKDLAFRQGMDEKLVIFASLTCALSQQSLEDYHKYANLGLSAECIDSTTVEKGVSVRDVLASRFMYAHKGVLFVTHATLLNETITPLLAHAEVIIDEVPSTSINHLFLKQSDQNVNELRKYCSFEVCPYNTAYSIVTLLDGDVTDSRGIVLSAEEAALMQIEAHSEGDNTYSQEFIDVLKFMVKGISVLYYQTKGAEGTNHVFKAVDYSTLDNLVTNAQSLTILGANIDTSLVGKFITNFLGLELVIKTSVNGKALPQKYKQKTRIVPFLKSGNWSNSVKSAYGSKVDNLAVNKLSNFTGNEDATVIDALHTFVIDNLGLDFIYAQNLTDKPLMTGKELADKNIKAISTACHGINGLRHYNKVACVAALNPKPDDIKLLDLMNSAGGLNQGVLSAALMEDRYLETTLQVIARGSVRNVTNPTNDEYLVVVADMRAAEYIASKFEDGYCTIDTSTSYELKREEYTVSDETKAKRDNAAMERLQVVVAILTDKKNKVDSMPNLLKKHGVSKRTFMNYKDEFKTQLVNQGLLKK